MSGAFGREDEDQQFDFEVVVHGVQKKKLLASRAGLLLVCTIM